MNKKTNNKFLILMIVVINSSCGSVQKNEDAKENANYIIENLNDDIVLKEFPVQNFKNREQLKGILKGIAQNCDWDNRDGKFVDFFTMKNIGGINSTAFIYEYYLKCDSLRFILTYNLDKEKPELMNLNIEPIEQENKMILYPEKQLINRK